MSRRVQTLLFTDIGIDRAAAGLGDAAWAALLVRYHGVIRAALAAHGGRAVDTAGDGFLARFDAPASAVRAAVAAVAAVAALRIEIRAGLHTGEVELDGEAMTGVGVHLAARVMGEAGPGQVLVSATVRELMAGSGLGFVDLGVREPGRGSPSAGGCSPSTRRRCGATWLTSRRRGRRRRSRSAAPPGSRFPGCCRLGVRPATSAVRSCWGAWSRPAGRRRPGVPGCTAVRGAGSRQDPHGRRGRPGRLRRGRDRAVRALRRGGRSAHQPFAEALTGTRATSASRSWPVPG